MIIKISCGQDDVYEIGQDNIVKIEETEHGNDKTLVYKLIYKDGNYLFLGLPIKSHDVTKKCPKCETQDGFYGHEIKQRHFCQTCYHEYERENAN